MNALRDATMVALMANGVTGADAAAAAGNAVMGMREAVASSLEARARLEHSAHVYDEDDVDAVMRELETLVELGLRHVTRARKRAAQVKSAVERRAG